MLNYLTKAGIQANDRLFDTLDTTTRRLRINDNEEVLLTDTVGFIRKLPHHLVEAFKATLEELSYADVLLHVIDASNPNWREQADIVESLITQLEAEKTPRIDVYNKCDLVPEDILPRDDRSVRISAKTGEGIESLLAMIGEIVDKGKKRVSLKIPYEKSGLLDQIHRDAQIISVEYLDSEISVVAVLNPDLYGKLKDYVV